MKYRTVEEFQTTILVLMVAFRNAAKRANRTDLLPCIDQMQEWRSSKAPQIAEDEETPGQWPPPLPTIATYLICAWRELQRAKDWLEYPREVDNYLSEKEKELMALLETPVPSKASSRVKRDEKIRKVEDTVRAFRANQKRLSSDKQRTLVKEEVLATLWYITSEVDKISR